MSGLNKSLSLRKHCVECGGYCCRVDQANGAIGSPIISHYERDQILTFLKIRGVMTKNLFRQVSVGNQHYYVLNHVNNKCPLLGSNNTCLAQEAKPLDCLCYPIKAVKMEGQTVFVLDTACPAQGFLSKEFIEKAKTIAMLSILRFTPETWNHWLKTIGWIKNAKIIE